MFSIFLAYPDKSHYILSTPAVRFLKEGVAQARAV